MKRVVLLFPAFAVICCAGAAYAEGPVPEVSSLEALVAKWSELRREIQAEKTVGKDRKAQWQREIELLEAEQRALSAELEDLQNADSSAGEKRRELLDRVRMREESLAGLRPVLDRAESGAREQAALVPASLSGDVAKTVALLPDSAVEADGLPVVERLQNVVALYTRIESLHNGVHVTKELVALGDGRKREVDVLYIGLARGFAVSADDGWAAVGTPAPGNWTWVPAPDRAGAIRAAISVFNRRIPATLVRLPMEISG